MSSSVSLTPLSPELSCIIAPYLQGNEALQAAKILDRNGAYEELTCHELCKAEHRFSVKPQNVSWKDHFIDYQNNFYERIRNGYKKWYNCSCFVGNTLILSGISAIASSALAYIGLNRLADGIPVFSYALPFIACSLDMRRSALVLFFLSFISGTWEGLKLTPPTESFFGGFAIGSPVEQGIKKAMSGGGIAMMFATFGFMHAQIIQNSENPISSIAAVAGMVSSAVTGFFTSSPYIAAVAGTIAGSAVGMISNSLNVTDRIFEPLSGVFGRIGGSVSNFFTRLRG